MRDVRADDWAGERTSALGLRRKNPTRHGRNSRSTFSTKSAVQMPWQLMGPAKNASNAGVAHAKKWTVWPRKTAPSRRHMRSKSLRSVGGTRKDESWSISCRLRLNRSSRAEKDAYDAAIK